MACTAPENVAECGAFQPSECGAPELRTALVAGFPETTRRPAVTDVANQETTSVIRECRRKSRTR